MFINMYKGVRIGIFFFKRRQSTKYFVRLQTLECSDNLGKIMILMCTRKLKNTIESHLYLIGILKKGIFIRISSVVACLYNHNIMTIYFFFLLFTSAILILYFGLEIKSNNNMYFSN